MSDCGEQQQRRGVKASMNAKEEKREKSENQTASTTSDGNVYCFSTSCQQPFCLSLTRIFVEYSSGKGRKKEVGGLFQI